MYGTVARIRIKPGMERKLMELAGQWEGTWPGSVASYIYRMDAGDNEYYLAVVAESKEAYFANANSPEQDARYREMLQYLDGEPEWHDGEIVYAGR